jgi:hypothetical protein
VSAHLRYEAHPASAVLPLLEGEGFDALVEDPANGLISPITLLGGRVLDGRNRMRPAAQPALSRASTLTKSTIQSPSSSRPTLSGGASTNRSGRCARRSLSGQAACIAAEGVRYA